MGDRNPDRSVGLAGSGVQYAPSLMQVPRHPDQIAGATEPGGQNREFRGSEVTGSGLPSGAPMCGRTPIARPARPDPEISTNHR